MAKAPRNQDDVSKLLKILFPGNLEATDSVKKEIKNLVSKVQKEIAKGKKSGRSGMYKGGLTKKKPVKKK